MDAPELIKQRYGNPFDVVKAIERAAAEGYERLTQDDLFLCGWAGLIPHRHEPGSVSLLTRQPNGCVTSEQLEFVAQIAEQDGIGHVNLTTRQELQLPGVRLAQAARVIARLQAAGLSTLGTRGDTLRSVIGCPLAGVDRQELFDASEVARQISDAFTGNPAYANLPFSYHVGMTACADWCIHPQLCDLALTGVSRQTEGTAELGFDVRVGGGVGAQASFNQRLNVFVKPEEALEVVRGITEIWRDHPESRGQRDRARFAHLIDAWGVAAFRQALEQRLGRALSLAPAQRQEPADAYCDHVGVHAQQQPGKYAIGAPVLVGRITSQQIKKIADLSRRYGDGKTAPPPAAARQEAGSAQGAGLPGQRAGGGAIRLTVQQNIVLLNIPEISVEKVLAGLAEVGLSINAHPVRRSVVTCAGSECCELAATETQARSRQIAEYLESRVPLDEPLRLHIAGCAEACAQYQIAHIGLVGSKAEIDGQRVDVYDICVGGQLGRKAAFNHVVLPAVPAAECARRIEGLLLGFTRRRKEREPFNDWCARIGDEAVAKLLTEGQEHPLEVEVSTQQQATSHMQQ